MSQYEKQDVEDYEKDLQAIQVIIEIANNPSDKHLTVSNAKRNWAINRIENLQFDIEQKLAEAKDELGL